MQFSSQEEYGLRCLLRLARAGAGASVTIGEIAQAEGISTPLAAKMMRILRAGGLVTSERGQAGGYRLARAPEAVTVKQALAPLGGDLFGGEFCGKFAGQGRALHAFDRLLDPLALAGGAVGRRSTAQPHDAQGFDVRRA